MRWHRQIRLCNPEICPNIDNGRAFIWGGNHKEVAAIGSVTIIWKGKAVVAGTSTMERGDRQVGVKAMRHWASLDAGPGKGKHAGVR